MKEDAKLVSDFITGFVDVAQHGTQIDSMVNDIVLQFKAESNIKSNLKKREKGVVKEKVHQKILASNIGSLKQKTSVLYDTSSSGLSHPDLRPDLSFGEDHTANFTSESFEESSDQSSSSDDSSDQSSSSEDSRDYSLNSSVSLDLTINTVAWAEIIAISEIKPKLEGAYLERAYGELIEKQAVIYEKQLDRMVQYALILSCQNLVLVQSKKDLQTGTTTMRHSSKLTLNSLDAKKVLQRFLFSKPDELGYKAQYQKITISKYGSFNIINAALLGKETWKVTFKKSSVRIEGVIKHGEASIIGSERKVLSELKDCKGVPGLVATAAVSGWIATQPQGVPLQTTNVRDIFKHIQKIDTVLQDVHKKGYVHGDVKPQNLIVGTDGARLIDFGVAVKKGTSHSFRGTLAYASIASIRSRSQKKAYTYTERDDLESLFYTLLSLLAVLNKDGRVIFVWGLIGPLSFINGNLKVSCLCTKLHFEQIIQEIQKRRKIKNVPEMKKEDIDTLTKIWTNLFLVGGIFSESKKVTTLFAHIKSAQK